MGGYIFIVSAPSGAGKTSLLNAFLQTEIGRNHFALAVSHTTRAPRSGDVNGTQYYFIDIVEFENLIRKGSFLEYAEVFKNYYGTSKLEIDKVLKTCKNIILEIDWQGAKQTKAIYKDKVKSIFILPPSLNELRNRLTIRSTDPEETINYRMKKAENEISHASAYDHQLVNNDFNETLQNLCKYFKDNI